MEGPRKRAFFFAWLGDFAQVGDVVCGV